jgi:hypothetical protein
MSKKKDEKENRHKYQKPAMQLVKKLDVFAGSCNDPSPKSDAGACPYAELVVS